MSKKEYLLSLAKTASERATCPDLKVGCVIATPDGHVLSTGYNGVAHGDRHCRIKADGTCAENGPNHRVIHSEANAVAFAARHGIRLEGSFAYITTKPCAKCFTLLMQAGIKKIIWK